MSLRCIEATYVLTPIADPVLRHPARTSSMIAQAQFAQPNRLFVLAWHHESFTRDRFL
jgi:hypothetical protein